MKTRESSLRPFRQWVTEYHSAYHRVAGTYALRYFAASVFYYNICIVGMIGCGKRTGNGATITSREREHQTWQSTQRIYWPATGEVVRKH